MNDQILDERIIRLHSLAIRLEFLEAFDAALAVRIILAREIEIRRLAVGS